MSTYKWSPEEEHLLSLLRPTNSYTEIAVEFEKRYDRGLAGFRSLRSSEAVRKKCQRDSITPESVANTDTLRPVAEHWAAIGEIQKKYEEDYIARSTGIMSEGQATRKILVLSDIHFPMARVDLLEQAIEDHADADICVLNGDILDGQIFSSFEKYRRIAALDEYNCTFNFVKECSERFEHVVLTEGNHDARPSRTLKTTGLPKEATQILRPSLIARIANGERLDSTGMMIEKLDFSNVHFDPIEPWYARIGKTLFIHPWTRGSSKPGWTVQGWCRKFEDRMDPDDFDSIVCGHTHKLYKGIVNGKLLIEQGCLAGHMAYAWSPKTLYHGNGQNGYAVIYQDEDGNTDFNKSHVVYLGEVLPPKKSLL
jgi:predicted phosphodiesterase